MCAAYVSYVFQTHMALKIPLTIFLMEIFSYIAVTSCPHAGSEQKIQPYKMKQDAGHRLDAFLAQQTHRYKIVLRGNHDRRVTFPLSGAHFALRQEVINIEGLRLFLAPFTSKKYRQPVLPQTEEPFDIWASHFPPWGCLDECYDGSHAGSSSLRRAAASIPPQIRPRVWFFGHIHEAHGARLESFEAAESDPVVPHSVKSGDDEAFMDDASNAGDTEAEAVAIIVETKKTLCLNVANANEGRAKCLVQPPTVCDVEYHSVAAASGSSGPSSALGEFTCQCK